MNDPYGNHEFSLSTFLSDKDVLTRHKWPEEKPGGMIKITIFRGRGPQESLFDPKFIKIVRPSNGERCAPPGANSMVYMDDNELFYCTATVGEIEMAIKAEVTE